MRRLVLGAVLAFAVLPTFAADCDCLTAIGDAVNALAAKAAGLDLQTP